MAVKIFILITIILLAFGGIYLLNNKSNKVCFNDNCFSVRLVETPGAQNQGLMFEEKLGPDEGMLFIFETEGEYSFWMKNTLIPLDIIWINENMEVVFMERNTQPCRKNCQVFSPEVQSKYVLELNAGIAEKTGINIGNKAKLKF